MNLQHRVSSKEFNREVLVGVLFLASLFAIFLYVALQRSTGRHVSPLAYLWPDAFDKDDERIPVDVFRTEQDRQDALAKSKDVFSSDPPNEEADAKPDWVKQESHEERIRKSEPPAFADTPIVDRNNQSFSVAPSKTQFGKSKETNSLPNSGFAATQSGFVEAVPEQDAHRSGFQTPVRRISHQSQQSEGKAPTVPKNQELVANPNFNATHNLAPPQTQVPPNRFLKQEQKPIPREPAAAIEPSKPLPTSHFPTTPKAFTAGQNDPKQDLALLVKESLQVETTPSDSYWSLAATYYGEGKYFRQLARFNQQANQQAPVNTDQLPKVVLVPPLKKLLKLKPDETKDNEPDASAERVSANRIRTKANETLFQISRDHLGSAARFAEIIQLNRKSLPVDCGADTRLEAGILLKLPQ